MGARRGPLIALGEGVYTVPEVARILQPSVTVYKVRRWLHKGLLGKPIQWGAPGRQHLLSFEQVLKARTIQRLRDSGFPLQKITPTIRKLSSYLFEHLFDEEWYELTFVHSGKRNIAVADSRGRVIEVETGQWIMPETLSELGDYLRRTRKDWERREIEIERFPRLVSNAGIVAGSPTIRGTRIETSLIAYLAQTLGTERVLELYPHLDKESVLQATWFEDAKPLVA